MNQILNGSDNELHSAAIKRTELHQSIVKKALTKKCTKLPQSLSSIPEGLASADGNERAKDVCRQHPGVSGTGLSTSGASVIHRNLQCRLHNTARGASLDRQLQKEPGRAEGERTVTGS